jgi:hypothetical protein
MCPGVRLCDRASSPNTIPPLPPLKWTAIRDSSGNSLAFFNRSSNDWEMAMDTAPPKMALPARPAN